MRFGERCPCGCGYVENLNWRPRFLNTEEDIIESENVPELAAKLVPRKPYVDGQWTYYTPKSQKWVYRVLTSVFKARGGEKWYGHADGGKYGLGNESGRKSLMASFNKNLTARQRQAKLLTEDKEA